MVILLIKTALVALITLTTTAGVVAGDPCYPAMFVFGDSLSDTGNAAIMGLPGAWRSAMAPYGETHPGRPTGRFSDGRLMIDFLATYLGLPFLNPFCNTTANFTSGVNYAVLGATALNTSYLHTLHIFPSIEVYIEEQLTWHLTLKAEVELEPEKHEAGGSFAENALHDVLPYIMHQSSNPSLASFASGLYVIEIGGNDYFAAFNSTYSFSYINSTFVPIVVHKIRQVAENLYTNGARSFLIFGVPRLGCVSMNLEQHVLATRDIDGCLQDYNTVAYSHDMLLLNEVDSLRRTHRDATFLFADYYGANTYILRNRAAFGLTNAYDACCGAGPHFPYSFDTSDWCSNHSSFLCSNVNNYINWMASTIQITSTYRSPNKSSTSVPTLIHPMGFSFALMSMSLMIMS